MRKKDIKVGEEYAVGRVSNSRFATFEDAWPGRRVRVVEVGVYGVVWAGWHFVKSQRADYCEVEWIDERPVDERRYKVKLTPDGDVPGRYYKGEERAAIRVPCRDFLAPWGEYVKARQEAAEQEAEARARDKARREDLQRRNRELGQRLRDLGLEHAALRMLGSASIALPLEDVETLVDLAEQNSRGSG